MGLGCYFFLQGIFPTWELNLCHLRLLHWLADSLTLCHLENLKCSLDKFLNKSEVKVKVKVTQSCPILCDSMNYTVQFSSVAQSCPTLSDPMNCSTPGLPVHHHLPEFTQTHVHRVHDAIQPSLRVDTNLLLKEYRDIVSIHMERYTR